MYDYSPNRDGETCPECGGSFRHAGNQFGSLGSHDFYYCENHVELAHRDTPDEVVGNEGAYCDGKLSVYEDGRVIKSGGDHERIVVREPNAAN